MGLFDRFKKARPESSAPRADEPSGDEESTSVDAAVASASGADEAAGAADADDLDVHPKEAPRDRAEKGPFDVDEEAPQTHRLDLGALSVPVIDGMQIRLETEDKTDRVLAVTMVHDKGGMQLQVFAAPRGEGIWKAVRDEIADGVRRRRGKADELYTDLGNELVTQVPVRAKDGRTGVRVTRFAGVDGPRWFLRAVFSGSAVTDKETRNALVGLLRGAVVDRGTEARPPRELIPLTPPTVKEQTSDGAAEAATATRSDDLDPFERGPEIAEVR
ncbi:DUF3710 domain-containing protein [Brevibacterium yomogidense]|uniref:DUF3710 domain-containing protein n=1 Tax=Brevibacterium yomogidense TaxID=946573 RepID=UPI0018E008CD|nr:DUF3710 domain-containing protein [Brevibacterium yomogidense]